MNENEKLNYNDFLVEMASYIQQMGVRRVMMDFQEHYPSFFQELKIQVNRVPERPAAALLRK